MVTLKYPEVFPVLQKAVNEETRKTMELADSTQCMKENAPILEEVIKLRHRTHPYPSSLFYIYVYLFIYYHELIDCNRRGGQSAGLPYPRRLHSQDKDGQVYHYPPPPLSFL